MKKTVLILLAAAVCLSLFAACGKSAEPAPAGQQEAAAQPADAVEQPAADEPEQPAEAELPAEGEAPADTPEEPAAEEPSPAEEPAPDEPEQPAEVSSTGFEDTALPADGVIRTAAELGKVLTEGDVAGTYKVDASELDMSGIRYGSFGREDSPFTGTFDFGGCTLKGLSAPLFLYTSGAEIRSLKIADTKIVNDGDIPEEDKPAINEAEFIIAKNRHGPTNTVKVA